LGQEAFIVTVRAGRLWPIPFQAAHRRNHLREPCDFIMRPIQSAVKPNNCPVWLRYRSEFSISAIHLPHSLQGLLSCSPVTQREDRNSHGARRLLPSWHCLPWRQGSVVRGFGFSG
jgi:hypothetical protein